jgi:hypothetical protein
MSSKRSYVNAEELAPRRKKTYDEDLLELETIYFFPKDLFSFRDLPPIGIPAQAEKSGRALAAYRRGLASVR